jgi:phosphoglycerate dehydrogenase-like enzyme
MTKIAVLDDYLDQFRDYADWGSLPDGCDVTFFNDHLGYDEDKIAESLKDFDIILGIRERTPFPESQVSKLPNLKLLITTGMHNASFDFKGAKKHGVVVCGTKTFSHPTIEHTWALILGATKFISAKDRVMHADGWQAGMSVGLKDKTLGVLGLGRLGSQVAKIGQAFGMNIIAWSQNLTQERCDEVGDVKLVDKDTLLKESDVLTMHYKLSDRSRGMISAKEFGRMKPSAYLVNTSRGPLIEEQDLIDALKNKTIAGAAIDVFWTEPLAKDHPIRKLDNALLTGHTGYVMKENHELNFLSAIEVMTAFLNGKPINVIE